MVKSVQTIHRCIHTHTYTNAHNETRVRMHALLLLLVHSNTGPQVGPHTLSIRTFSRAGHKEIVQMFDYFPNVSVRIVDYWPGHTELGLGQHGTDPFAVDVHTVLNDVVLRQRQRQPMTNYIHAPLHLCEIECGVSGE